MNEVWKAIPDYNGVYEVSSLGRVRSNAHMVSGRYGGQSRKPGKTLRLKVEKTGYLRVCLRRPPREAYYPSVHRLVATAFIPNPSGLPVVNHKDGDKLNNCAENLEWCTQQQNCVHAVRNNLYDHARGASVATAKLTACDVVNIRSLYDEGISQGSIAKQYGIDQSNVSYIVNRKKWKHVA